MTRFHWSLLPVAVLGVLLLAGCPPIQEPISLDQPATGTPATRPSTGNVGPSPYPISTLPGESYALGGARLQVEVRAGKGGALLPGADISIIGPGLGFATSDATGSAIVGPLPLGTYEVRVAAEGRVPVSRTVQLAAPRTRVDLVAELPAPTRTLTGRVQDAAGQPLECARVALGLAWTITDSAGDWSLATDGGGDATIAKTGYQPASSGGGTVALQPVATRVSFENDPFGTGAASAFATLRGAISGMGWTVADRDPTAQIRLWAAPKSVSDVQARDAASFVQNGGKLVILAEWGGASGYDPEAANRLLLPLGVAVNPDLVRDPGSTLGIPEWFNPWVERGTPAARNAVDVALLGAASVAAAAPSIRILSVPSVGYRVQDTDSADPAVAAARQVATGLVMGVGDTSAWLDGDIARQENLKFMRGLLAW